MTSAAATFLAAALVALAFGCAATYAKTGIMFSTLGRTIVVNASPKPGEELVAGEDKLMVKWRLNETLSSPDVDSRYKKVKIRLCYAPESQVDRAWRKTEDDLHRDKTCQFGIAEKPYSSAAARKGFQTVEYAVEREIPTAVYFIRIYAFDSNNHQVAFGQTTDKEKTQNLFRVRGVSGQQTSIDIAAAVFSAFSVVSFIVLYVLEKRKKSA